jgi:hypothetical protein
MKADQVERILDGIPGVRKDAGAYVVPEESETSFYISLPAEVLTVARISRVERGAEHLVIETHQGDRYHVLVDTVAMVKVSPQSKHGVGRGTGFR